MQAPPSDSTGATATSIDLSHLWLHVTQMADFERRPTVVESADGITVRTTDGRVLTDAVSAAMVTSLGYSNERVRQALKSQVDRLAFWPLLHAANDVAVELSKRLCALLPGDLDRAFLLSGGSEATETAMKMARQYHVNMGRPRKTKIVGRYLSYHGATRGALDASGMRDKAVFEPLGSTTIHALPPDCYRCPFGRLGPHGCDRECVEAIGRIIELEGRDTVAAVIVDPVMAGGGIIVPPQDYYARLREICGGDVLLIFDEVLTGFGRLGHWFAADHYGVVPDIICLGKGMSGGYAPLAAAVARRHVADAFLGSGHQFQHIHTFGGNPLSAAVGLAVIEEFERLDLVRHADEMGRRLLVGLRRIAHRLPQVGDVRGLGLLAGVELVRDRETREPFRRAPAPKVVAHALEHESLLLRCSRNVVQLAPPLIVTAEQIDDILARTERALIEVCETLDASER